MRNIKFTVRYDGTDFKGWQTQPGYRTVQETLETVVQSVIGQKVFCNASGRTDAGVHAIGQVVNFYCDTKLEPHTLLKACNSRLPEDVSVSESSEAEQGFCANKSAVRKMYRYVFHDGPARDPIQRKYAWRSKWRLDEHAMAEAAKALLGRHDFHSFETEWPNRLSSIRTILDLKVFRQGELVQMEIEADGFLYNMVRSIAGTLLDIGRGYWPIEKMKHILEAEDRTRAGMTAPPEGLFLVRVSYE